MHQENDTDGVLITAMASLVVSSSPRKTVFPVSSLRSPGRRRKFYVVSVGKRTGVFESWFVLPLVFLIAVIYLFLSGRMFINSQVESVGIVRNPTLRTMKPGRSTAILKITV
jgi:hypothetical protein